MKNNENAEMFDINDYLEKEVPQVPKNGRVKKNVNDNNFNIDVFIDEDARIAEQEAFRKNHPYKNLYHTFFPYGYVSILGYIFALAVILRIFEVKIIFTSLITGIGCLIICIIIGGAICNQIIGRFSGQKKPGTAKTNFESEPPNKETVKTANKPCITIPDAKTLSDDHLKRLFSNATTKSNLLEKK